MSELFSNVYHTPCCFKVNAEVLGRIERLDESDSGAVLRFVDGSGFCGVPDEFRLVNAETGLELPVAHTNSYVLAFTGAYVASVGDVDVLRLAPQRGFVVERVGSGSEL
jgi:hypothetical protein